MLGALGLVGLGACGSRAEPAAPPAPAPGDARLAAPADATAPASPLRDATQLVLAVTDGWDATSARLQRYERVTVTAAWQPVGAPVDAVVGRAGTAWGRGLHGAGAPAGRAGAVKQEGDGRAPAGAFRLLRAFGYAAAPPAGAALPYAAVDASWRCVDDPASAHYNAVLDADGVAPDWSSAEQMRRDDDLYAWVVEVDHNAASRAAGAPVPGGGSCIFLHVWDGPGSVTAGCTAMTRPALEAVLAWLRPGAVYVLLPRDEHAALAGAWQLPAAP